MITKLEVQQLYSLISTICGDVQASLSYDPRKVNCISQPIMPWSLATHYEHLFNENRELLLKLKSEAIPADMADEVFEHIEELYE